MYVKKSEARNLLQSGFDEYFDNLRTKNDRIFELTDGDDWSFVIKTQTMIESALTNAVLANIGEEKLRKTFQVMPLVGEVSKLTISKDLGVTTSEQRRFITTMASLRNRLAHNPEDGEFTFAEYLASLNSDQRKSWQQSIPWFAESPEARQEWGEPVLKSAKVVIYIAATTLVALLDLSAANKSILKQIHERSIATTTELLSALKSEIED